MNPPEKACWKPKSVKFNPQIVETSIGGTQRCSALKKSISNSSVLDHSLPSSNDQNDSIHVVEQSFFLSDNESELQNSPIQRRKVRSYPSAVFNQIDSPTTGTGDDSSYKLMKSLAALKRSDFNKTGRIGEDSSGVTVAVRVRPFTKR